MNNKSSFTKLIESLTSGNETGEKAISELSFEYITNEVAAGYEKLSKSLPGFCKREQQQEIIKACTKSMFDNENLIAQAGTGTGKTYAYTLAAIPFIKEANRPLIISTHTVSLQSQLFEKDIPTLLNAVAPELSFQVAKGSNRYLCPLKAERFIAKNKGEVPESFDMFDTGASSKPKKGLTDKDYELARYVLDDYLNKAFNGDLDTLTFTGANKVLPYINRDFKSCNKKVCKYKNDCPFYKQRDRIMDADIVITNHALLSIASNAISLESTLLTRLSDSILVIDEAHHFHDVYRNCTENQVNQSNAENILSLSNHLNKNLIKIKSASSFKQVSCDQYLNNKITTIGKHTESYFGLINELGEHLQLNFKQYRGSKKSFLDNESQWNLNFDAVGTFIQSKVNEIYQVADNLDQDLGSLYRSYRTQFEDMADSKTAKDIVAEWDLIIKKMAHEFVEIKSCFARYKEFEEMSHFNQKVESGLVRWIKWDKEKYDIHFFSNDAKVAEKFQLNIATKVQSLILTSATIESLNSFSLFKSQLGYSEYGNKSSLIAVGSPFDNSRVQVHMPLTNGDPNSKSHSKTITQYIEKIVSTHKAVLVLFCSNNQMNATYKECAELLQNKILLQHDYSKSELINLHKLNIDNNHHSILFGVDGLSEGIDLQDKYLTCVVITKLPFPNLSSPIMQYESKALEVNNGNSFRQITLPMCSRKLIQSTGRLIRTERDFGDIYILDPRINQKYYGSELLHSLPMMKNNHFVN